MIKVNKVEKIQEIRAIQALADLDLKIQIDPDEVEKFSFLKTYFGMSYDITEKGGVLEYEDLIQIDHSRPSTSILSVSKPLIYSEKILKSLRAQWPEKRGLPFSFCGFISVERKFVLEQWIRDNFDTDTNLRPDTFISRKKMKLVDAFNFQKLAVKKYGEFHIWSSKKGRKFPVKSWDQNYYDFLLKSKFVICPSGLYVWTYRFFEAIMCGAIPVVEETCEAYAGFKFYMMDDDMSQLEWSEEVAQHNFELCIARLTLSPDEKELIQEGIVDIAKDPEPL